jgi:long-chain acyl-CoA synthetase|tara:strand:- start:2983 stop:4818 length:1836 start_codon:yes stop_codon:yes gene_type:complete
METFPSLLQQHITQRASHIAIRMKRYGIWNAYTWQEISAEVSTLANGFAAKGLQAGDRVAVIGNNVPQLFFAIIASQSLGAVPVPLHADSNSDELRGMLVNCNAKFIVLQDQQQADAVMPLLGELSNLSQVIYVDTRGIENYNADQLISFADMQKAGEAFASQKPNYLQEAVAQVTPDTDAFIVYTAGTSGTPRGAVLTHSNFLTIGQAFAEQEKLGDEEEVFAYLPLAYSSALFYVYTLWMIKGYTINCPESNETTMSDMREVGPTFLYGPPHFFKTMFSQINSRAASSKSKMIDKHLGGMMTTGRTWLGSKLVFEPIKDLYGLSRIKNAYVGGDMVSNEVFHFFRALGINLKTTYGSAESAGCISIQQISEDDLTGEENVVGTPLRGVEVKILDNHEIAFKGPNAFKGYFGDAAQSGQAKDAEGWVKTGDVGELANNTLKVLERIDCKSSFSTGADFIPKQIENALKASPYIKDVVVVGEQRDHSVALIVIDGDTVGSWADMRQIQFTGLRELATKTEVVELISERVRELNTRITQVGGANCPPIKRYTVLNREFSVAAGEMTRSRKIRRQVIGTNNTKIIEALFAGEPTFDVTDSAGELVAKLRLETA